MKKHWIKLMQISQSTERTINKWHLITNGKKCSKFILKCEECNANILTCRQIRKVHIQSTTSLQKNYFWSFVLIQLKFTINEKVFDVTLSLKSLKYQLVIYNCTVTQPTEMLSKKIKLTARKWEMSNKFASKTFQM